MTEQGLPPKELHDMVAHAAPFTHAYGNRRFHDWVFSVQGMVVSAITNLKTGASSAIKGMFVVYETCDVCHGGPGRNTCKECLGVGEVKRYRRPQAPRAMGVMQ
jgi:hypothetical protein